LGVTANAFPDPQPLDFGRAGTPADQDIGEGREAPDAHVQVLSSRPGQGRLRRPKSLSCSSSRTTGDPERHRFRWIAPLLAS
jgi:hypothetical protein